jgi:pimeloyl-ACP methyl ester carboxylesterase
MAKGLNDMKRFKCNLLKLTLVQVLALSFVFPYQGTAQESNFKINLKHGPYAVGFKSVNHYDYSRNFNPGSDIDGNPIREKARPLQTGIWYPVKREKVKDAQPMHYKEYIYLLSYEKHFGKLTDKRKKKAVVRFFKWLKTPEEKRKEQEVRTAAFQDAEPARGRFPLVVYGPSINSFSFENALLMEYLAGWGYIVVSSPCTGRMSRRMTPDLMGVEAQARDMEFLVGYMHSFPNADNDRTALMGFSWGGLANVLTAMRDSRVSAIVCLDGTICYPLGYKIIKQSIYYKPDHIRIPALFMRSRDIPEELFKKQGAKKPDTPFVFYDTLKYSTSFVFRFHHLVHRNFSSAFNRFRERQPEYGELDQAKIENSYSLMCEYVRNFLDAYLKGETGALSFMKKSPQQHGIPESVLSKKSAAPLVGPSVDQTN